MESAAAGATTAWFPGFKRRPTALEEALWNAKALNDSFGMGVDEFSAVVPWFDKWLPARFDALYVLPALVVQQVHSNVHGHDALDEAGVAVHELVASDRAKVMHDEGDVAQTHLHRQRAVERLHLHVP